MTRRAKRLHRGLLTLLATLALGLFAVSLPGCSGSQDSDLEEGIEEVEDELNDARDELEDEIDDRT